jgi:hypothetical protein
MSVGPAVVPDVVGVAAKRLRVSGDLNWIRTVFVEVCTLTEHAPAYLVAIGMKGGDGSGTPLSFTYVLVLPPSQP